MTYLPPSTVDSVYALLEIIANPEKAKAVIEEMKKHADVASEALENARKEQMAADMAQSHAAAMGKGLVGDRKALEDDRAAHQVEFDARQAQLDNLSTALSTRQKELDKQEVNFKLRSDAVDKTLVDVRRRENLVLQRENDVQEREDRVKSILEDLGPLAAKLKL